MAPNEVRDSAADAVVPDGQRLTRGPIRLDRLTSVLWRHDGETVVIDPREVAFVIPDDVADDRPVGVLEYQPHACATPSGKRHDLWTVWRCGTCGQTWTLHTTGLLGSLWNRDSLWEAWRRRRLAPVCQRRACREWRYHSWRLHWFGWVLR